MSTETPLSPAHGVLPGTTVLLLAACLISFLGCEAQSGTPEALPPTDAAPHVQAATAVEAGRYLATIGGCNDCHTAGYLENEGNVPEADWLTGSLIGWRGPWGTTYPRNLRLTVQQISEDAFVTMLHTRTTLPPMPWANVNKLSEQDARAIYRYIQSLGPKGEQVPAPVPPDQEPATPYYNLVPQHLERLPAPAAGPASAM